MSYIINRFNSIVEKYPDKKAIVSTVRNYTYKELAEYTDRLKKIILDFDKDIPIFLLMPRSALAIIGMIAALKSETFFIPLDPKDSINILKNKIKNFEKSIIISEKDYTADFIFELWSDSDLKISINKLENYRSDKKKPIVEDLKVKELAYAMFTSGSTGQPKCVLIPQIAVLRLVVNTNYIVIGCEDNILQFAPITFDASTFEIWGALLNGATLFVYEQYFFDLNVFNDFVKKSKINIMWLTAAVFHLVVRVNINILSELKFLLSGGDVVKPSAVRNLLSIFPHITFINGYGPTENTTFTCCYTVSNTNLPNLSIPIGKPITGTNIYICDEKGNEVKDGETGELYTSGDGLALGYWIDGKINEKNFIINKSIANGRIYKTGDIVRKNKSGNIEFIGRIDKQVKIRGVRISLEQVQDVFNDVMKNHDIIVEVIKDELDENILIAFILLNNAHVPNKGLIKRSLADNIPNYMVPDIIEFCKEFPINKNGKIDRKKLLILYKEKKLRDKNERE